MTHTNIVNGFIAGFLGTLVLAVLMIAKSVVGFMPNLIAVDLVQVLSHLNPTIASWIGHFIIGTVFWGGLFAWIYPHLPSKTPWLKGTIFSVGAWLMMMVAVMPLAGVGFFALNQGIVAPITTLVMHMIFGVVLGVVYGSRET